MNDCFAAFEGKQNTEQALLVAAVTPDHLSEIDSKNHWFEAGEQEKEEERRRIAENAVGMGEYSRICYEGRKLDKPRESKLAALYSMMLAWLTNPGQLRDSTGNLMTLEKIGAVHCCSKQALSRIGKDICERIKYHARVQKKESARAAYSEAAKNGWANRREKQSVIILLREEWIGRCIQYLKGADMNGRDKDFDFTLQAEYLEGKFREEGFSPTFAAKAFLNSLS